MKFLRQLAHKEKGVKAKWKRPRGIHSKLRLNKAGHHKKPSSGYRAPRKERFLHPSGAKLNLVTNLAQLSHIDGAILISSKLGLKKRIEILKKAQEMKLKVLNIKNTEDFIKKAQESVETRKKERKEKQSKKKKSKEETLKKAEKEKKEEKKETEKVKARPEVKETPQDFIKKETKQMIRPNAPKQK